jgi:hypothetical protein
MSCSGLHCAGCAGGVTLPVVPLAAAFGLAWLAEHIVEVAAVCATCGVLAVLIVVVLMRWADRRDARPVQLWHAREDIAPPVLTATVIPQAIAPAIVFNFYGAASPEPAPVVRTALPGTAGDAITQEE